MSFAENYLEISKYVKSDLVMLEEGIINLFESDNPIYKDLLDFLTTPSKRLRPLLGILFCKSLFNGINHKQREIILAVELIHNATLIHDDVIDNSKIRRNKKSMNAKFDSNFAVIAGDFLLSAAMERIINTDSVEVFQICTQALKSICIGEMNQYFTKFKITSIDEYIEKSRQKTALLFEVCLLSCVILAENSGGQRFKKSAVNFAQNFGIAFQIRDDLINITKSKKLIYNDIDSGIYTAPVIYAYEKDNNILNSDNILQSIKTTQGIEKTKDLMDNYFDKAISGISDLEDNVYKQKLLELVELFKAKI